MILDLNADISEAKLSCDICIIGSGAAGITIAREFIGLSQKVIVLEAGGEGLETRSQEPYQSQVIGLACGGIHGGRARVLGGTTTLWAGQALPLLPVDFQKREWVSSSGWPIERQELSPFYQRAEEVMQIPHATYDALTWPSRVSSPPAYDDTKIIPYYTQFTSVPNFAQKYKGDLEKSSNITLITHANAVSLEANKDASALQEVNLRSFQGKAACVQAKFFVVCCGGIESARLLLASASVEPHGIGNQHDIVGRFFMDHPGVSVGVTPQNARRFSKYYDPFRANGLRYVLGMRASEHLQREERIQNVNASVYYPIGENDAIEAAKQLLGALRTPANRLQVPEALAAVAHQPGKVAAAVYRYYVLRQPSSVGSTPPRLGIGGEQSPNRESRITLGAEVDSLGMRRSVLDWQLTDADIRSFEVFARAISSEWNRLGIANVNLSDLQLSERAYGTGGGFVDANHHMGTTRMGTNPTTSVVDPQCRVHGYDNLYIGSSSVFPTGGFSNPTLTIIALCLRLGDEIKRRMVHPVAVSGS